MCTYEDFHPLLRLMGTLHLNRGFGRSWLMFLLLSIPAALNAQFEYCPNNGTVMICGYACLDGPVEIPAMVGNLPVTKIGGDGFHGCTNLTAVIIPTNIISLDDMVFAECINLRSVEIPNSVNEIGRATFYRCISLPSVTIPEGVHSIPDGFTNFASPPLGILKSIGLFSECSSLTNVTIPSSLTNIGKMAFSECTNLTRFQLSGTIVAIGDEAFRGCINLTAITIPDSVTTLGNGAFRGCANLASVTIPNAFIGNEAFAGCTRLTNVTMHGRVSRVGDEAFRGCINLTTITIPDSVTTLGNGAFRGCTNLASVTILNGIIGNEAFAGCTRLTNVIIGGGVTTIQQRAFYDCSALNAVYACGNAPHTADDAFDNASQGTFYYLPGASGWGPALAGRPTAPWVLPSPVILTTRPGFGVTNSTFGFILSWATNASVVVEASSGMANPLWSPLSTNALNAGSSYFSDPDWAKYPGRVYRVRWP